MKKEGRKEQRQLFKASIESSEFHWETDFEKRKRKRILFTSMSFYLFTHITNMYMYEHFYINQLISRIYTTTIYMTYYTHQITHNTLKADWWLQGIPLLLPLLIIILLVCSYQPSSHSLSFSSSSSSSEPGATTHTFLVYSKKFQSCWSSSSSFTNTHVT